MRVRVGVQVGSLTLINSEIEKLRVDAEIGEHSRCTVEFIRDQATDLAIDTLLDATITVTLEDDEGLETIFEGEVVDGEQEHLLNAGSRFRLEGTSRSAQWDIHRRAAVYPNATLADVARRLGATAATALPKTDPLTLIQHDESDFAFVRRLAFEAGCFVRPTAKAFEVRVGFDAKSTELHWGDTLLRVRARAHPVNPGFKGAAAQLSDQRDHRFHAVRKNVDALGGAPALTQMLKRMATKTAGGGDPHVVLDQRRAPTLAAFRKSLERSSESAFGQALLVDGSSIDIRLTAGARCEINGSEAFSLPMVGKFGVVRVSHRFEQQLYANEFAATPFATFVPQIPAPAPLAGVTTAVVTDNQDPERRGWLRVRFPWMNADEKSRWIPLVTPFAGHDRGLQFMPEVGDQVVVIHEQGDPERPVVLGAIWNGKATAVQHAEIKRLVSKSGHALVLDDRAKEERIELFTAGGKCVLTMQNGSTPTLTLHSEGDMAIEVKGQLRIHAGSLVEQTDGEMYREAGGVLTVVGKAEVLISAARDLLMDASKNARLAAGAVAESIGGALNQVIGAMVHLQPPGGPQTQRGSPKKPKTAGSTWKAKQVPAATAGSTSADRPTPRGNA